MYSGNLENIELEYSPSPYSKRFKNCDNPNKVIDNFIELSEKATTSARQLFKHQLDVRYGGDNGNDNQLLDIYYKNQEFGTPIFVYIHGGYWQMLDKSTSGPIVHTLCQHNFRVLLVDYDLCPKVTLEQLTQQIRNFYKWLKEYSERTHAPSISISGHSVGAHLALELLNVERITKIKNLFLISGLYDLRELWSMSSINPKNILSLNEVTAETLSPMCWDYSKNLLEAYKQQGLNIYVMAAQNDSPTFQKQSHKFTELLNSLQLKANYKEFEQYDHFDIIEELVVANSPISCYIKCKLGIN